MMNAENTFRVAMFILILGYQIPRVYYRIKARRYRDDQGLGEGQLSESKIRLFLMGISGIGANVLGLIFLIQPAWLPWTYLNLPDGVRWQGGVIGLGTVFMSYAIHRTLALNFTPTLQTLDGHTLVTEGIYKRIRHPMYTSFFLLFAASALLSASWLIALLGLVYSLLIVNRVSSDEKMLIQTFGQDYRRYQETSNKFLPGW